MSIDILNLISDFLPHDDRETSTAWF